MICAKIRLINTGCRIVVVRVHGVHLASVQFRAARQKAGWDKAAPLCYGDGNEADFVARKQ